MKLVECCSKTKYRLIIDLDIKMKENKVEEKDMIKLLLPIIFGAVRQYFSLKEEYVIVIKKKKKSGRK